MRSEKPRLVTRGRSHCGCGRERLCCKQLKGNRERWLQGKDLNLRPLGYYHSLPAGISCKRTERYRMVFIFKDWKKRLTNLINTPKPPKGRSMGSILARDDIQHCHCSLQKPSNRESFQTFECSYHPSKDGTTLGSHTSENLFVPAILAPTKRSKGNEPISPNLPRAAR